MDALWSMGVRYAGVNNVVRRYSTWVEETHGTSAQLRTASQLLSDISLAGGPKRFATEVVRNSQRTSSRNGVLKVEAVEAACSALGRLGIDTPKDLRERWTEPEVKKTWLAIKGQRSGISWRYLLMNVRLEDVKPDRMIVRFVAEATGGPELSAEESRSAILAAFSILAERSQGLTLRGLDHAIWRYQKGKKSSAK